MNNFNNESVAILKTSKFNSCEVENKKYQKLIIMLNNLNITLNGLEQAVQVVNQYASKQYNPGILLFEECFSSHQNIIKKIEAAIRGVL